MSRTVILWAGSVADSFGGGYPGNALGEPNGDWYAFYKGMWATLTSFRGRLYTGLSALFEDGYMCGDRVTPRLLATADLIAFEGNGYSAARSGGWESCDWYFKDGVNALSVPWVEDVVPGSVPPEPVPRDPHILANGSISGAAYSAFFGFPSNVFARIGYPDAKRFVASFLLFRLRPEINVASPEFRVRISGVPAIEGVRESTPDLDAVGILACHHEDDEPADHK